MNKRVTHGMSEHPFYRCWTSMKERAKRNDIDIEFKDIQEAYQHCLELGWKKGMTIGLGSREHPNHGSYKPGNIFICQQYEATSIARAKTYQFIDPTGRPITITNLAKFCRKNRLSQACMWKLQAGIQGYHKGYTMK